MQQSVTHDDTMTLDSGATGIQETSEDAAPPSDAGQAQPPAEDRAQDRPHDGPAVGYRGVTAFAVAGITYRQLDYWARTGLVVPSVRDASGSGTQRLYSF